MSKLKEEPLKQVVERLNPQARCLLSRMKVGESYSPSRLQELLGEGTVAFAVGAVGWLRANKLAQEFASASQTSRVSLANKGRDFLRSGGVPEGKIIKLLKGKKSLAISELSEKLGLPREEVNPILGNMKKEGVIAFESGGRVVLGEDSVVEKAEEKYGKINELLQRIDDNPETDFYSLDIEDRNIVESLSRKRGKGKAVFRILREVGLSYKLTREGEEAQKIIDDDRVGIPGKIALGSLTPEVLEKGLWQNRTFRKYDLSTRPRKLSCGRKHPYGRFLDLVRKKLVAMGFEEMKGRMVETEFWNNDVLFMPQDHPAREIHDVYFIKEPQHSKELPQDLVEKVAQTHESGGKTGSLGWGYKLDKKRTSRFVLRSQGTANSAHMLASHPRIPGKYFAIARCFRYDQVDATHAPDFYQIEGIVLSPHMNFRRLLGLLKLFALEIAGSQEVKFLPSYFPFTEPSVEVHFQHKKLGWIELGGAGIFRKEVTVPLGIEVPVIAWGLGLDRMAMVALSLDDIRDLFASDLGRLQRMEFKQNANY